MKISILLISYNHSSYIGRCIESVIMQEVDAEVELIVADDYSSDNTLNLIKEAVRDTGINTILLDSNKNIGFVKNYERGFAACTGNYIAVIEGDDYWTNPKRLKIHTDFLELHHECVMSMNKYITFLESEHRFIVPDWKYKDDFIYITGQEMALENRLGNMSACVFRKSEINKIKSDLFDLLIADWMIGMVLCEFGLIAVLKDPTSVYRIHNKGQYSGMDADQRIALMNKHIVEYNEYLNRRYENEFKQHLYRINNHQMISENKISLKNYIPPIIIAIVKWIIPSAFKKQFRSFKS